MKYGRNVDDYMDLYARGLARPPEPHLHCGTLKVVQTENTHDDDGPIQHDVLYLIHYTRDIHTSDTQINRIFYRQGSLWVHMPLCRLSYYQMQRFHNQVKRRMCSLLL